MLLKSVLILLASVFLANSYLRAADDTKRESKSSYAKLEVKGTLFHKGPAYYIETYDSAFTDVKLIVKLERSEDKNRVLDRHLETLEGKSVVANGFLDCRRVGQEPGVIYIYLNSESQLRATEDK